MILRFGEGTSMTSLCSSNVQYMVPVLLCMRRVLFSIPQPDLCPISVCAGIQRLLELKK